jgi:hypothetical protein
LAPSGLRPAAYVRMLHPCHRLVRRLRAVPLSPMRRLAHSPSASRLCERQMPAWLQARLNSRVGAMHALLQRRAEDAATRFALVRACNARVHMRGCWVHTCMAVVVVVFAYTGEYQGLLDRGNCGW